MSAIPFGPEHKDGPWSWGSWLTGIVGFALLFWIATGFDNWVLSTGWLVLAIVLGLVFSARSGRSWLMGRPPPRTGAKGVTPTVDVRGRPGSTYVILEPPTAPKSRVKPREFGPIWWALYSVGVRAPVHLGDFILTGIWRVAGSLAGMSTGSGTRGMDVEAVDAVDYAETLARPDDQRF